MIGRIPILDIMWRGSVTTVITAAPALDHIRGDIEHVSRLRYSLAHESSHVALLGHATKCRPANLFVGSDQNVLQISTGSWWRGVAQSDPALASITFTSSLDEIPLISACWPTSALAASQSFPFSVGSTTLALLLRDQKSWRWADEMRVPFVLLELGSDAVSPDHRPALQRLLDGILAALCFMLVSVLVALTRHPHALSFVLVMLAACLCYGRRDEPSDHAFLPIRRYQTSLGSCPQS